MTTPASKPPIWDALRPEVQRFAIVMERVLRHNDHKGGWRYTDARTLLLRTYVEMGELHKAMLNSDFSAPDVMILREAADVANFCMMIADNLGGLALVRDEVPAHPPHALTASEVNDTNRRLMFHNRGYRDGATSHFDSEASADPEDTHGDYLRGFRNGRDAFLAASEAFTAQASRETPEPGAASIENDE